MSSGWMRYLLIAALGLGLAGCVAYPDPYYGGYGYGYGPAYYGPPVTGSIFIGGGGWHDSWGHRHWR